MFGFFFWEGKYKKFTTIFFIHLKCYANTHQRDREEERKGRVRVERERARYESTRKAVNETK